MGRGLDGEMVPARRREGGWVGCVCVCMCVRPRFDCKKGALLSSLAPSTTTENPLPHSPCLTCFAEEEGHRSDAINIPWGGEREREERMTTRREREREC